jgi:DNA-directed RNA polymerase specialized sigma24 family protein
LAVYWHIHLVEVLRRYSKQPALWKTAKRLGKLVYSGPPERIDADPMPGHVHRLDVRLSVEAMAQLAADYEAGVSSTELRERYGLSKGSVLRLLQESGVKMRRRPLGSDQVNAVVERYRSGLTIRAVAAELGVPKTTVQDALRREGVVMRAAGPRRASSTDGSRPWPGPGTHEPSS